MIPLGDEAQVEACFGPFGDSCTFCVERAIGSEIVWMHPVELLGDMGHVESHFFPFGECKCRCKIGAHFASNVPSA